MISACMHINGSLPPQPPVGDHDMTTSHEDDKPADSLFNNDVTSTPVKHARSSAIVPAWGGATAKFEPVQTQSRDGAFT